MPSTEKQKPRQRPAIRPSVPSPLAIGLYYEVGRGKLGTRSSVSFDRCQKSLDAKAAVAQASRNTKGKVEQSRVSLELSPLSLRLSCFVNGPVGMAACHWLLVRSARVSSAQTTNLAGLPTPTRPSIFSPSDMYKIALSSFGTLCKSLD